MPAGDRPGQRARRQAPGKGLKGGRSADYRPLVHATSRVHDDFDAAVLLVAERAISVGGGIEVELVRDQEAWVDVALLDAFEQGL